MFLGTPHRGSEKASYGNILADVATTVMHKPSSRLTSALQRNSPELLSLTSEFRHQLPNYQVVSFYEMQPMKPFSSLVSQYAGDGRPSPLILSMNLDRRETFRTLGRLWGGPNTGRCKPHRDVQICGTR